MITIMKKYIWVIEGNNNWETSFSSFKKQTLVDKLRSLGYKYSKTNQHYMAERFEGDDSWAKIEKIEII